MRREDAAARGDPIGPLAWGQSLPYVPAAASDQLGWVGLEAARYRALPAAEHLQPALTHHQLVLFVQPPDAFALRYEGVTRHVPPPPARSRWCRPATRSGCARAGARTSCSSSWSRSWSPGLPPRRSTSTRRG